MEIIAGVTVKHAADQRKPDFDECPPSARGFEPTSGRFESRWPPACPRLTMSGMSEIAITVRGEVEPRAIEQLRRCAQAGDAVAGAICADCHVGYSQPIGRAFAYPEHISPSGVGYHIACIAAARRSRRAAATRCPSRRCRCCARPVLGRPGGAGRTAGPRNRRGRPAARPRVCGCATAASCAAPHHEIRTPLGRRHAGCCGRASASRA